MCGVLGFWGDVQRSQFEHALERLQHRGPDGAGIWRDKKWPLTLGHRRLAIIDPTDAGAQPMHLGDHTIVFNGEIYNFLEIRSTLQQQGYQFSTHSDTEVLLAAYDHWGPSCLSQLNGMWAIAIWNRRDESLFLSRDRFGKKPLFYCFQQQTFIFGSEMKALMPLMRKVSLHEEFAQFSHQLFSYESTDQCLIKDIVRFPAGAYAVLKPDDIENGRINLIRYWDTLDHLVDVPETYQEQVERFRELFVDACRLRMRSDVPIGTALSGGIDSSAVACTMHHVANHVSGESMAVDWQRAFVATFPGTLLDEREYAESVVDHIGAQGVYLPIDPAAGMEKLGDYLYLFEELYWTTPIPMIDIYRSVADDGVKVTIDGHGADELLSGYDGFLKGLDDSLWDLSYAKHVLRCWGNPDPRLKDVWHQLVVNHRGKKGLLKFLAKRLLRPQRENIKGKQYGHLNQELYSCFHQGILPTLLRNYDRCSMAASVEIRMPFMDHRLVSFCFSLPWQSKIPKSSTYTKAIIRDAIGPWMPKKVRERRSKIGFSTPVAEWFKRGWKDCIMDTIQSQAFAECELIDSAAVKKRVQSAIEENVPGHEADRAWAALMPFFWQQSFLRRAAARC